MVVHGNIRRGYEYPLIRFAVISETDVFGQEQKKKKKKHKTYEGRKIASFTDLSIEMCIRDRDSRWSELVLK